MRQLKHGINLIAVGFLLAGLLVSCSREMQTSGETAPSQATPEETAVDEAYGDCTQLLSRARAMDSVLLTQDEVDASLAAKGIGAFTGFAYHCQGDSLAPVYLIKTAQVARAVNNIPQARLVLEICIKDYPKFRDRPAALFLLGQLYDEDNFMNNEHEAAKLYNQILAEYPNSDWAQSAKGALRYAGKTDEEILRDLKQKSKE